MLSVNNKFKKSRRLILKQPPDNALAVAEGVALARAKHPRLTAPQQDVQCHQGPGVQAARQLCSSDVAGV